MLVPIKWLKEYADIEEDIASVCEKMVMSGSNIETTEKLLTEYKKIVVGKILKIEKHPQADKLLVTQMDIGEDTTQIITGADNIFEGAYVPVILDGGILPDGTKIKKGKLRGLESNGMLCSPKELGFADKVTPVSQRDGIMILEGEYTTGQDIAQALDLDCEYVIDFEITPNRPDCLSMIGMAREAAAVFPQKIKYPDTSCEKEEEDIKDYISVAINRPEFCKRYVARAVKDVKIAPSPWWMQKRLMAAGVRPINNIVDVTNYVMLEYGQPLHAFDIRQIEGNQIIVDTALEGQMFTTLDGTERKVFKDTLLIQDGKKPVAMAGVMGGLNSEIMEDTTTILIEAANFDADNIRATSKKIGLRTEASSRFEKGVDPELAMDAADRACRLIETLNGGTVVKGAVDVYPGKSEIEPIKVRTSLINSLLGINLSAEETAELLERLEIRTKIDGDVITALPPTVRLDLKAEIDFVEEVARIYGYDMLPLTLPKTGLRGGMSRERQLEELAKNTLTALGYNEVQTYSFVSPKGAADVCCKEAAKREIVRIINPLGEENSVMRTTLIPNILEVFSKNCNRNISGARAFELGKIFIDSPVNKDGEPLPHEVKHLLAGAYGAGDDFYTLKGVITEMLAKLGIKALRFEAESGHGTFHPGRCANIISEGQKIGVIGELHPDVAESFDLKERIYLAEFDFDQLCLISCTDKLYVQIPKYPAMQRDIALVVSEEISVSDLEDIIRKHGKNILENIELFDIYRGKQIKEGCKSIAFSMRYRDKNKTLTEEEVSRVHNKVLAALKEQTGAELREV